jgi:hypothetical protein
MWNILSTKQSYDYATEENLQTVALELEKQERTIVKNFQLHVEARRNNTAIFQKMPLTC